MPFQPKPLRQRWVLSIKASPCEQAARCVRRPVTAQPPRAHGSTRGRGVRAPPCARGGMRRPFAAYTSKCVLYACALLHVLYKTLLDLDLVQLYMYVLYKTLPSFCS